MNLLGEILGRSERVTFIFTTRESLEFMKIHFQGLQAVRIKPLDEHSSENLVHGLLARNATSSDCNRITQICGRVPLAIKLLCSSISEDNVQPSQFLDEFMADKESNIISMLDCPDFLSNLRLKVLFDSSFQRLYSRKRSSCVFECSSREFQSRSCCSRFKSNKTFCHQEIAKPSKEVLHRFKFQTRIISNAQPSPIICKRKGRKRNEGNSSHFQCPLL